MKADATIIWPTADEVARVIVAAARVEGEDPISVATGRARSRARIYAFVALAHRFPTVPSRLLIIKLGVDPLKAFATYISAIQTARGDDSRGAKWFSVNALNTIVAAVGWPAMTAEEAQCRRTNSPKNPATIAKTDAAAKRTRDNTQALASAKEGTGFGVGEAGVAHPQPAPEASERSAPGQEIEAAASPIPNAAIAEPELDRAERLARIEHIKEWASGFATAPAVEVATKPVAEAAKPRAALPISDAARALAGYQRGQKRASTAPAPPARRPDAAATPLSEPPIVARADAVVKRAPVSAGRPGRRPVATAAERDASFRRTAAIAESNQRRDGAPRIGSFIGMTPVYRPDAPAARRGCEVVTGALMGDPIPGTGRSALDAREAELASAAGKTP